MLVSILEKKQLSHVVLRETLKENSHLNKKDRSFLTRLTEGTVEYCIFIDYIIDEFSKTKVSKMKPLIRNILRLSVYQIKYMDSVPDSAVCNEAVKLAEKHGFAGLKGFVNGVLRNIARSIDDVKLPNPSEDMVKHLSVKYSMPVWIVEKYIYSFGIEDSIKIFEAYLSHDKKLQVRCNTSEKSVDEIVRMLCEDGVKVTRSNNLSDAIYIENYDYLEKLQAFLDGYIQVQNFSSMLAACIADPKEGYNVIDMCAAPGGKTMHMADIMKNTGHIISRDINEKKVNLIRENLERFGYTNVEPQVFDATVPDARYFRKMDLVMCDIPCSGLGVISRKPDIKYNVTKESIESLIPIQRNILSNAVRYLKKGGKLVFSTCTINTEENMGNYNYLMEKFKLKPADISDIVPKGLQTDTLKDGYLQILPDKYGNDGFFICKFIKK